MAVSERKFLSTQSLAICLSVLAATCARTSVTSAQEPPQLISPEALPAEDIPDSVLTGNTTDSFWNDELRPFLESYCYACHSGAGAEADIDFSTYDSPDKLPAERPRWNQVRGMIEIGAMPPPDYDPLPSMELRESIADWIDRRINTVDCGLVQDSGRVTMRRLNNVEYDNSVKDLLAIDFPPSSLIGFPTDGVGNGFDNQGDVLTLSPIQVEKYMQAARLIAGRALVLDPESLREQEQDVGALYATDRASVSFLFAEGSYHISTRLKFEDDDEKGKIPVALLVDGREIERWQVDNDRETYRTEHQFSAGLHQLTLHFVEDPTGRKKEYSRRVESDNIRIEGPKDGSPALPDSHLRLIAVRPDENRTVAQAATEIFTPLMRRAFRREARPLEIQRVVQLVNMACEQGESFESAVGIGLQSILVSPHFLFRVEQAHADGVSDQTEPINDYALASRLSYFLWSSLPDDRLLDLASQGQLNNPDVLKSEAKRMLADSRSIALVKRFFSQLLGLGNLQVADPNTEQFPLWNDLLREAMRRETELFCYGIVREDLSIDTLLTGDYTYINPRLAELYGMPFDGKQPEELYYLGPGYKSSRSSGPRDGIYLDEDRWVRVELPANRRGILTQASILTLTSNPTSTSPVKRGKWILENVLGDPPPPAPPNVPGFEETKKQHGNLSLRQQLEIHRANPSCASCHRVMDPLGLGFENFDAIGQWRERDGAHLIDAAGSLADGQTFNGSLQLVDLLRTRQGEIYRHFAENLLTYALGRGLEPYDNCAIEEILDYTATRDFRLSAFVEATVVSEPFRQRRAEDSLKEHTR